MLGNSPSAGIFDPSAFLRAMMGVATPSLLGTPTTSVLGGGGLATPGVAAAPAVVKPDLTGARTADIFRAYNAAVDQNGNINQGTLINRLQDAGLNVQNLSANQKNVIQNLSVYAGYMPEFLDGTRSRNVNTMTQALELANGSNAFPITMAKVGAVFKNDGGNYNNGNIEQLLIRSGRRDLADRPGVGNNDVQSWNALVQAVAEGSVRPNQVFDTSNPNRMDPNNLFNDDNKYLDAISYVTSGAFDKQVAALTSGTNLGNQRNGVRQMRADRQALGLSAQEANAQVRGKLTQVADNGQFTFAPRGTAVPPATPAAGAATPGAATAPAAGAATPGVAGAPGAGATPPASIAGVNALQPQMQPILDLARQVLQTQLQQGGFGVGGALQSNGLMGGVGAGLGGIPTATPQAQLGTTGGSSFGDLINTILPGAKQIMQSNPILSALCSLMDMMMGGARQNQTTPGGNLIGSMVPKSNLPFGAPSSLGSAFGGGGLVPQAQQANTLGFGTL